VASAGRRLEAGLQGEAEALGQAGVVREKLRALRLLALGARLAAYHDDMEASLARGELAEVARVCDAALKETREEAGLLGRPRQPIDTLMPIRRKALQARWEQARRGLEGLLAGKKYVEVEAQAKNVDGALAAEAGRVGAGAEVGRALLALRKKALAARLDQARQEALALLAKDRYQGLAEAVEKAVKQLADEARVVGMQGELEKFRATWDAVLELARQAGKVERE
jgi:hypothetical protein